MSRIAIAQVKSSTDKRENLDMARALIDEAKNKGAQLIAFPEFLMAFSPGEQSAAELAALAESIDGPFVNALRKRPKHLGPRSSQPFMKPAQSPTASSTRPCGSTAAETSPRFTASCTSTMLSVSRNRTNFIPALTSPRRCLAADARCGVMICYDLRFPEMARMLALGGADILFAPSGWVQGDMKLDHWQTMIKARALENGCYVVAPDQTGNIYIGHSLVVDPFGRMVPTWATEKDWKSSISI